MRPCTDPWDRVEDSLDTLVPPSFSVIPPSLPVVPPSPIKCLAVATMRDEKFLVLPHPEVATYVERKATDRGAERKAAKRKR